MSENAIPQTLARARATITVPLWTLFVPVVLAALLLVAWERRPDERLHVWVLDTGRGDAVLVRTPHGHTALIDGGLEATPLLEALGEHLPPWQHNLDILAITSPQQERLLAQVEVLDRYTAASVAQPEFTPTAAIQRTWLEAVRREGAPVQYAHRGDTISLDTNPDVRLHVLYPPAEADQSEDPQLTLKLEYGDMDILLAGSADEHALAEMVRTAPLQLRSDVLLVPRHGNEGALTTAFLQAVGPGAAIITAGTSSQDTGPAPETLDALQASGVDVYTTADHGTIELIAEPGRLWLRPGK
jgi:competence protein ComEC